MCQSSVGSSNQNYRLKHICEVCQGCAKHLWGPPIKITGSNTSVRCARGVPNICGVLQSKLQAQTHLWGVPGCVNHLWDPPIKITGLKHICEVCQGGAKHLWGPPIKITGSNTSVRCARVCQTSVGSSNQNYRPKHICGVYQGVSIICGVLQSKLQAQTHL